MFLAVLPGEIALPSLFRPGYTPGLDRAILELGARHVTRGVMEVGPYSRFGWFHPGPAIYYLLAGPYLLTGEQSAGILFAALIINTATLMAIGALIWRQAGTVAAVGVLALILVMLRSLPVAILADPWNPYLPVLPFALLIVLAWTTVAGRHRWLPALPVLASVCIQMHVSYVAPCLAVLATTAILLALRRTRPRVGWRAWLGGSIALLLVWMLPIYQQLSGRHGNLADLWDYFTSGHTTHPWWFAWRLLSTELGRPSAFVLGVQPHPEFLAPPEFPGWTALVTIACFTGAVALAIWHRDRVTLEFGTFAVVASLTGLLAIRQVTGVVPAYVVQWVSLTGVFAWITVLLSICAAVQRAAARPRPQASPNRLPASAKRTPLLARGVLVVLVAILAIGVGADAGRTRTDNVPDAAPITAQLVTWLKTRPAGGIEINYQGCTSPSLLCTYLAGGAVIDQLVRHGVTVKSQTSDGWQYVPALRTVKKPLTARLLLGFSHGGSPPPPTGWHRVAESGQLVIYAAPPK
jgi:hypothetical protein